MLAAVLVWNAALSFSTFAATDRDYYVEGCSLEQQEDGQVIASWEKPELRTTYQVRLLKNGYKVTSWAAVKTESYDFTEVVRKNGTGLYQVEVYSPHQGFDRRVISEELDIDSVAIRAINTLYREREANAVKAANGVFSKVDLQVTETRVAAGKVRPIVFRDGAYFTVGTVTYSIPLEQWKTGVGVSINVELLPKKGYSFAENMTVTCSKAESVKITGSGDRRTVSLVYIPYEALAKPHLRYVSSDGILYWEKVDKARYYFVEVYVSGTMVEKHRAVKTQFDLTEYLDRAGITEVRLYANAGSGSYNYVDSTKVVIENLEEYLSENRVQGTIEDSGVFHTAMGVEFRNCWQKFGADRYYFDANGKLHAKGWFQDGDGSWYYFNDYRRALCSEWLPDSDGSWYYFGPDCRMMANTVTPDGYFVGPDGRWVQ